MLGSRYAHDPAPLDWPCRIEKRRKWWLVPPYRLAGLPALPAGRTLRLLKLHGTVRSLYLSRKRKAAEASAGGAS
jgi:hypothetical protein